jgi:zinc protease
VSPTLTRGLSPVRTTLTNGVVMLVQPTAIAPAVTINATIRAGGAYDPQELTGLAYLTGRVLDRGTERRPADVIAEELDELGVALRVTNTRHLLVISCTCLAEDVDQVLSIVLDVIRRPVFPEAEVVKRRAEALTAVRQDEDNPAVRANDALAALLYAPDHPYGRPGKGTAATLQRIQRQHIVDFHARRVRPGTLSLAIVGDLRAESIVERVGRELEEWSASVLPDVDLPPVSRASTRRERAIAMPGKSQTDIAYGFVAVRRLDPRYYAYWMMNHILGEHGLGGRLGETIRERQGMAYYALSAFDASFGEGPLVVRAGVDPENVTRAVEAIDLEVQGMGEEGPTPTEVEETRDYLVGSIPRLFETNSSIAVFLQTAEQFGLGLDYDRQLPRLLRAVTLDEIKAAAAETLIPERAAVAIAGPPRSANHS